jgi:alpha-1,6-mannosyltransferase
MTMPPGARAPGAPPVAGTRPGERSRAATAGLAATGASIVLTFTVAVLGPSLLEPRLPGRAGQPPWALAANVSPYLAVALTATAIAAGTAGLALTLRAARHGWSVSPAVILAAGIIAAVALALVPPFGSSDHLSYAAYGRMVITGHDPYTTTPAALARLGDPVARAVQDWRTSPSVYGALATAGQALASAIGGTSARLTVFVLDLLNVAAFAVTGLLLHRLARGNRARQLRAALLWTCNPLLLQVLVAGAHVDSQAIVLSIGALAVFTMYARSDASQLNPGRQAVTGAAAGALIGLGFAVKATMALVGAGLALACVLAWRAREQATSRSVRAPRPGAPRSGWRRSGWRRSGWSRPGWSRPGWSGAGWRGPAAVLGGLVAGFGVTASASLAIWGTSSLGPALRAGSYVSIGSPWRAVRSALRLVIGEGAAEDAVKGAAVVLAVVLLVLLLRSISAAGPGAWPAIPGLAGAGVRAETGPGVRAETGPAGFAACAVFAVVLAWLLAWPYVLPWYDGLGWALLALLPASRLDWLMLARTTALALGYLPARGIVLPGGLRWLETVIRTALTPAVLLAVTVVLVVMLRPWRGSQPRMPGRALLQVGAGGARLLRGLVRYGHHAGRQRPAHLL